MPDPLCLFETPRAWPFEEAARVAARLAASGKRTALFETGYGPSGLPHIGTFGEVARTTWVRRAFERLTGLPSRLLAFSDDMDGLRKVPDNVPNREMLAGFIGQPLTRVPDPFGTHESFGAHNNARLRTFLDGFGFEYEFASSTDYYARGVFDAALMQVAARHAEIVAVILPTLGPDRRATYSPFLPLHPVSGRVMQVRIDAVDAEGGTLQWQDPDTGVRHETAIRGGACKLQWKADWAMRWHALDVDYEMSGKDLIDSVRLSSRVCQALGSAPPVSLTYELFLDENHQKISKSKGNGLSVEEWLAYAPPESLGQFMYNQPARAKRLFFDVIPRAVDEFLANAAKLPGQDEAVRHTNPAWHVLNQADPETDGAVTSPVPFGMLLNLASVVNADTPDMLWGFLRRYSPEAAPGVNPFLDALVGHAIRYYQDIVRPQKRFRAADAVEHAALLDLAEALRALPGDASPEAVHNASPEAVRDVSPEAVRDVSPEAIRGVSPEAIQDIVYEVGKRHPFPALKAWFACLYEVLLGQAEGPRFGGFVALYGVTETVRLIEERLVARADAA